MFQTSRRPLGPSIYCLITRDRVAAVCVQSRSRDPYPCMDGRCLASYISSIKFKSREFSPPSSLPPSRDPQENITRTSYSFIRVKQHTSLTNSRGLGRHEHHEPNSLRQEIVLKRSFGNFICLDCRQYIYQEKLFGRNTRRTSGMFYNVWKRI